MDNNNEMTLTHAELTWLGGFMSLRAIDFNDHSCNDFFLDPTDGNKSVCINMYEELIKNGNLDYVDEEDIDEDDHEYGIHDIKNATDELNVIDVWVMEYVAKRCELAQESSIALLSPAEYSVIADLLEHIDGSFYGIREHNGFNCWDVLTHAISNANKAMFIAAVKFNAAPSWQEDAEAMRQFTNELDFPEQLICRYLVHKCKILAGLISPAVTTAEQNQRINWQMNKEL